MTKMVLALISADGYRRIRRLLALRGARCASPAELAQCIGDLLDEHARERLPIAERLDATARAAARRRP